MGWGNRPWKKMGSSLRLSLYIKVVPRFNRSFYNWTMSFYRHFFVFMECHFNHISPHTQIVFIKWKFFNRCILYKHGCPPHLIDTMIWPANVPPFMLYLWGCPLHFIEILLLWNGQGSPPWADSRGICCLWCTLILLCCATPSSDCDWMILFAVILGQYSGAFVSVVLESTIVCVLFEESKPSTQTTPL